jgi:manganese efflux pump family protein
MDRSALDEGCSPWGDWYVRIAALVTWLLAALVGLYLLRTWVAKGGLRTRNAERSSRFAPMLILGHGGLAASGLGVWIGYLAVGAIPIAWAAFAILIPVATLGATMFGLWLRAGHGRVRGRHTYAPRHAAEDHFPPPAVLGHGAFAVTTVVLVLLTALRV